MLSATRSPASSGDRLRVSVVNAHTESPRRASSLPQTVHVKAAHIQHNPHGTSGG